MISNQYVTLYNKDLYIQEKLKEIIQYALKYNRIPMLFYYPGHYISDNILEVVKKYIDKDKISVIEQPPSDYMESIPPLIFKPNCDVYYAYSMQAIIQSQIKPQLIFFTRMVNEASFNVLIDQIPKVCYYSDIETSDHGMVGPGNNYYAKM